jgi:biopolymer transport protein ExbB
MASGSSSALMDRHADRRRLRNKARLRLTSRGLAALGLLAAGLLAVSPLAYPMAVLAHQSPPASPQAASASEPPEAAQHAPPPTPSQAVPLPGEAAPSIAADSTKSSKAAPYSLRELSPWSMFMSADVIVKVVMMALALASLATWTIFFAKTIELLLAQNRLSGALDRIGGSRSLDEAQLAIGPAKTLLQPLLAAATLEIRMSDGMSSDSGVKERAASRLSEIVRAEARAIQRGMGVLATIGATSPFVGLFGTVWGIMNSFIGISKSQTTNLAVVAPGIAEALLATAIGLVAAIPAVVFYNHLTRTTKRYLELVGRSSGAAARLLSRDLDRAQGVMISRAAE